MADFLEETDMWHYHRSYGAFAGALITAGSAALLICIGGIHQFFTEDWIDITILLIIGILFITAGILVKRWAHKNGKK